MNPIATTEPELIMFLQSTEKQKSIQGRRRWFYASIVASCFIITAAIYAVVSIANYSNSNQKSSVPLIKAGEPWSCPNNGHFDWPSYNCICDAGFYWDQSSYTCKTVQTQNQPWSCPLNGYFDWTRYSCVCNSNFAWDGKNCAAQTAGQPWVCPKDGHFEWSSYKCECNSGFYWDGSSCVASYAPTSGCLNGYEWNGWQCVLTSAKVCAANQHYEFGAQNCWCNVGFWWDGAICQSSYSAQNPTSGSNWGSLTNYDPTTGGGACDGIVHSQYELIAAIHTDQLQRGTSNSMCGKSITIYGNGKSSRVKVVDECSKFDGCTSGTVDVPLAVWNQLGMVPGRQDITWSFS